MVTRIFLRNAALSLSLSLFLSFSQFLVLTTSAVAENQGLSSVINRQTNQIKNLSSRVETLENTLFDMRKEVAELKKINDAKHEEIDQNRLANKTTITAPVATAETSDAPQNLASSSKIGGDDFIPKQDITVPQDKQEYDIALGLLKEGKLAEAESKFSDFVRDRSDSKLHSNAIFWYAETFYRQGAYNKAAIHYLQGYKQYPKDQKAPDSLLKLAYALNALNKDKEACSMLDKLEKEFPNRPINSIKRAKDAQSKFQCGK